MNYSNKVNLKRIFEALGTEIYTVVKLSPDFPNYYPYSDIDIFCLDIQSVVEKISSACQDLVKEGWVLKTVVRGENQIFVDLYEYEEAEKLDFRFDLYSALPEYQKLDVKNALFYSVLESRIQKEVGGVKMNVASQVDEAVIRYLEYIEWFEVRPDKIKHLDWIVERLEQDALRDKFLEKLHFYVSLSLVPVAQDSHFERSLTQQPAQVSTVRRIARKIKRVLTK